MIRQIRVIIIILFILSSFQGRAGVRPSFSLDDIILDIYNAVTEFGEVDYEQLQTDLYTLHESPIDLNNTSDEELTQLYFLSPQQIDAILAYAYRHPFESLYELRLIPELADYEIRDLLPFVYINRAALNSETINTDALYAKEIFAKAHHELLTRIDARNIEAYEGTDPIYTQFRYRFDFRRRVTFGVQLRRPAGGFARDLQYGAYLQLNKITPHLHTLVAGNFQASFGQGLVLAPVFHSGKSMYVTSVGQQREGLRYYSSVDGQGLHGAGATLRWEWNKTTRLDVSALYSMRHANDSTWHHLLGANLTLRHKKLQVELTAIENLWSDSIHPYTNAKYNRHYFRGRNQAVIGASFRYNHGWFDAFGEIATAQNHQITNDQSPITKYHCGFGTIICFRFYPTNGISLLALYRYYSPYFDNALGYAFSETSRLGDENGGYLGFDITRLRNWRFIGYGDIFYFSGYKYGLGDATRTLGYDAMAEIQYSWSKHPSFQGGDGGRLSLRLRARQKGDATYSTRAQFDWAQGSWSLRTTAEANIIPSKLSTLNSQLTYGYTIFQDISYSLPLREGRGLGLRLRLQGFDAREWANRIYTYEHDVLYAYSIPAVYGLGGRGILNQRRPIIPQLALHFRASETVYARKWAAAHSRPLTRTDLHLLLRATF